MEIIEPKPYEMPKISNISARRLYNRLEKGNGPDLILDVRSLGEFLGSGGHI